MKHLSTNNVYIPFMCKALGFAVSAQAVCIMCIDDVGYPIAGVVYDGYNGAIIHAHIWVDAEKTPSRDWYAAIFDYPFNKLRVKKVVGQVSSVNEEAQKLDEHFGFELVTQIDEYYENGSSLMVYTMTREQCRILNSPSWAKVIERIR
jgi:RimJ/RimL family protein N-acetyltransferase